MRAAVARVAIQSFCAATSTSRAGPDLSSSSTAATTNTHPPGRSPIQVSHRSKSAANRGSPRRALRAGVMTWATKRSAASLRISTSSFSFEEKCAKSPLLDIPTRSASRPMVTPARPSSLASASALSSTDARVSSPLVTGR